MGRLLHPDGAAAVLYMPPIKKPTHRNTDRQAGRHRLDQRDVIEGGTAAQRGMQMDHECYGKWEAEEEHCCGRKQCDAQTDRQTYRQTDKQTDRRTYRQTHTDRCMDKQTHRQRSKRQTGATGERAAAEGGYMGMGVANLLHQSPSINGTRAVSVGVVFLSCLCHISIFAHLSQLQYQAAIVCAHCEANSALWGYRYVTVLRETALS